MTTTPDARAPVPGRSRRLLLVDDHEVVRAGLVAVLSREPGLEIVGTASTGREAVELARSTRPDVAILDLRLPDIPGDTLCRELRSLLPELTVIILSSSSAEHDKRAALDAGAASYVTKNAGITALRAALAGGDAPAAPPPEQAGGDTPTPQQARVLELAAHGLTYRAIAKRLVISEATVRFHIQNLKLRYGVASKTELVVRAIQLGLVDADGAP